MQTSYCAPAARNAGSANTYLVAKGFLSPFAALVLCVPLAPIIAILYVLVRLTSRGPGFYSQSRLGLNGAKFTIYKLRSMRVDAEHDSGPVWASQNDARVTPIGRFLRAWHLDELPQIFNILKGDMCFVGPRPERPEIATVLAEKVPNYDRRLKAKPGVTGMAQLHLPSDTSVESVRRKLRYDLAYLRNASPLLDLRIVLATACKLVPFAGRLARRLGQCAVSLAVARELLEAAPAPVATPVHPDVNA